MSSFWIDLLFLHGYITDHKWARRRVNKPEATPTDEPNEKHRLKSSTARPSRWYARLCLGIGDGAVHTQ